MLALITRSFARPDLQGQGPGQIKQGMGNSVENRRSHVTHLQSWEQLGSHSFDYIWNVAWYDLTGALSKASEYFSKEATTEFIATLNAQVHRSICLHSFAHVVTIALARLCGLLGSIWRDVQGSSQGMRLQQRRDPETLILCGWNPRFLTIALFVIAWVAAAAYYYFLFAPFKAKLRLELRQVRAGACVLWSWEGSLTPLARTCILCAAIDYGRSI
eukprot:1162134-Pelagomonas_calceolata.AAC.11